jgi:hypothetical protein
MLVLDTTSKTITAVLTAAPATNQPNYVVAWADNNGTTFTEGASDGTTNSTTTVTMVASPAASTRRVIKSIYIQNTDTAQVTVTVGYYNGTNTRVIAKVILNVGDTWTTDATFDPNGQLKYVFGSVNASTQLINQVPILNGGTGQSTQQAALTALSGAQTSGQYLRSNGTNTLLSAIQVADVPTLNQNTTGTAAGLSSTLAIASGGTGSTTLAGASIATYTGTETLTNKRIDPRVTSAASASSLTPSIATADVYAYTALAAGLTINAPTGTPVDGNKLIFRLLDNGTARALTWDATYTVIGVTLPTTTVASKTTYVGCIYNANNTRWDVIAVGTQA